MPARRPLRGAQHHVLNGDAVDGGQGLLLDHRHIAPLAPVAQHHAQAEAAVGLDHQVVAAVRQLQEQPVRLDQNGLQILGLRFWSRPRPSPHGRPAGRGPAGPPPPRPPARRPEPARSSSPSDRPPHGPTLGPNEAHMIRRPVHRVPNRAAQSAKLCGKPASIQPIHARVPAPRHDVLADQHGEPAGRMKHPNVIVGQQAARHEGLDLGRQTVRPGHLAHFAPEGLVALVGDIVQDQEVAGCGRTPAP